METTAVNLEKIVEILAWPLTVVLLALIFRRALENRVRSIKTVSYGDKKLEIGFQEGIDSLKRQAQESLAEAAAPPSGNVEVDLYDMAEIMPNSAVMEAWKAVEASAKALIARRGLELDYESEEPYKLIQDTLMNESIIEEKHGKVFQELRMLRNKVAHAPGFQVKPDQADDYVRLALTMKHFLDQLG